VHNAAVRRPKTTGGPAPKFSECQEPKSHRNKPSYTLGLLHAELASELFANKREAIRLRTAMMQVEAVVKMLQPGFNAATIAANRRNQSDPWFKRGCDNVLEVFNGNKLIAYRLTIQPSIKQK
jgi:hypothetical protein